MSKSKAYALDTHILDTTAYATCGIQQSVLPMCATMAPHGPPLYIPPLQCLRPKLPRLLSPRLSYQVQSIAAP
jgi:hypothetical protein